MLALFRAGEGGRQQEEEKEGRERGEDNGGGDGGDLGAALVGEGVGGWVGGGGVCGGGWGGRLAAPTDKPHKKINASCPGVLSHWNQLETSATTTSSSSSFPASSRGVVFWCPCVCVVCVGVSAGRLVWAAARGRRTFNF